MKLPVPPPAMDDLMRSVVETHGPRRFTEIIMKTAGPVDAKGRYLHWDKLRYLTPPNGLTSEEYWLGMKMSRQGSYRTLPFKDKYGKLFSYMIPDPIWQKILWIEKYAGGTLMTEGALPGQGTGQQYLVNSLVEESITSSQLEGAATTRRVAKEMLQTGREPRDVSERMIFNNYMAMRFLKDFQDDDLTPQMVMGLHHIVTEGTMQGEDEGMEGVFRRAEDDICVFSADEVLLHAPPSVDELPDRLQLLCDFANQDTSEPFIPPLIKAIILHFMIGYDHPFVDGNGRTARALFYWFAARKGYWLMEYVSISRVLKAAPTKYMYAYLETETDDNDLTYFIAHQVDVIKQAIEALQEYIRQKQHEVSEIEKILHRSQRGQTLNHRQVRLLQHAVRNPGEVYTIQRHKTSHGVSYQTARTDLLYLADDLDLLSKLKQGKRDVFIAPGDIVGRLHRL